MIQDFFQLQREPFTSIPTTDQYFPASSIEAARTSLVRLVDRDEGPALVIGPVGTGKTLLCQLMAESFRHRCRVVALPSCRLPNRRALLQLILFELGLSYRGMDEGELRLSLIDHVTNRDLCPYGVLLLIDESESLSLTLLDELRTLSNLTCDNRSCIRQVLFGTPRLEEKFTHPRMESFNQRLAGRFYLEAFSEEETAHFVVQTFDDCGGVANAVFTPESLQTIHGACGGIPRLVNQLADHALVLVASGCHELVDSSCVEEAWADLQQLPMPGQRFSQDRTPSLPADIVEFGELSDGTDSDFADDLALNLGKSEDSEGSAVEHSALSQHAKLTIDDEQNTANNAADHNSLFDNTLTNDVARDSIAREDIAREDIAREDIAAEDIDSENIVTGDATMGDADGTIPASEVTLVFHSSNDPFGDDFEEEELVLDSFISSDALAQRHRRQVQGIRSERLAEGIVQLRHGHGMSRDQAGPLEGRHVEQARVHHAGRIDSGAASPLASNEVNRSRPTDKTKHHEEDPTRTEPVDIMSEGEENIITLKHHAGHANSEADDDSAAADGSTPSSRAPGEDSALAPHNFSRLFSQLRRRG